ncbi:hypothetical protein [Bradyrhizobium canariense]|uniref:Uncharacterized protein n=1 Tax=Bradyrhizobium canariense TaxID=255045 RepID=A0A1X3GWW2_9BRAD|nr:hypothetical protein [Bradyrhizobium canariense]OSI76561.1 hypothetical protein BSZ22_04515 [Bradyrhizobium canariense]OSI81886.1 hypothetical protein BSZ23_04220 [Bradyrhizobium canariense]OSI89978.1 hypothetical protein BSZ25_19595 [Bradyrhizobium canariense]OSI96497.1 hypothetical protein BSZ24_04190 [Bradyrhizobium canariense]OSJ01869.1 hypothetical protein BSZ18_39450 [Bradyrhizobium canariense]
MKKACVLLAVLILGLLSSPTFARGGMGSHQSLMTSGVFGSSAATPGTNSLGTALSSDAVGNGHRVNGPLLGTNPAIDREEAKVDKMIDSICRGC